MDIKELIEQLNARGLSNGSSLGYHCGLFDEAATALSTLQAENNKLRAELEKVKAERNGRWIMHDNPILGLTCECSECHIETCGNTKYCPACGAKMDEVVCDEIQRPENK